MLKRFLTLCIGVTVTVAAMASEAPKYVFYFIGDGMGMAQALSAQVYNRTVLNNSDPILMMQFPVASQVITHSASSSVTDSAAAGTALSTGSKTKNGMLGMDADTVAVVSIAKELFDRGYGVALVTSVSPDDATPGAFFAHVPKRSMFYEIGKQMAECGYDFIAGSTLRGTKDKDGNLNDLLPTFEANGVEIAYGLDQLKDKKSSRVLLLNPENITVSDIGYTIDSIPGAMTLPDMTVAAFEQLRRNGRDRFFMMVEGGNIDHAAHSNDGGGVIKEVLNFNQALKHAYDFYLAHPDETLIVVTADHETGGMALGNNDMGYKLNLKYVDYQKISKDSFADFCASMRRSRRIFDWPDMKEYLEENMGFWREVPVTEAQTEELKKEFDLCFKGDMPTDHKTLYKSFNSFTDLVYSIQDKYTGLGFTTNGHSGGLVPVYAIGVGADKFATMNDNTDLPAKIREIVKIAK